MRYSFTQPICLDCWSDGWGDMQPSHLLEPEPEICAFCGLTTEDGIYIRIDPATVMFPTITKDSGDAA